MTSSEQILVAGHLHPAMLFLRIFDGLRAAVLPALIALVARQTWILVFVFVLFTLNMCYALVRYLTFEYRLSAEELVTREGIVHRQERRIPVNRIQDLNFEQSLLRRMLGLVVVSVETASGKGSEARLDSVGRRDAERMKEALYRARAAVRGAAAMPEAPPEYLLHRASASELFLLGITNQRLGAILAALFGALELLREAGLLDLASSFAGQLVDRIARISPPVLVLAALLVALMALVLGWVVSIAASFVMFHGFTLTLREAVLVRRYGLITTRAHSLPLLKVQRVLVEQSFVRRVFGFAIVKADSAGGSQDPSVQQKGGLDVVVPFAERARAEGVLPWLLPGLVPQTAAWQRVSPRVIWRVFCKGALLALVAGAGLAFWAGLFALLPLVLLPCAWLAGVLAWHRLGYAQVEGHVALRWGLLGSYRAWIPLRKVQAVVLRADPIDRLLGIARLTVFVAGGSPTTLPHLVAADARRLEHAIGVAAGRARFVW